MKSKEKKRMPGEGHSDYSKRVEDFFRVANRYDNLDTVSWMKLTPSNQVACEKKIENLIND